MHLASAPFLQSFLCKCVRSVHDHTHGRFICKTVLDGITLIEVTVFPVGAHDAKVLGWAVIKHRVTNVRALRWLRIFNLLYQKLLRGRCVFFFCLADTCRRTFKQLPPSKRDLQQIVEWEMSRNAFESLGNAFVAVWSAQRKRTVASVLT